MKYYTAIHYIQTIKTFETEYLPFINIEKADAKRDGAYTIAIDQIRQLKEGEIELEDIFGNPDNTLRNILKLAFLDAMDASTKK